jgi:hypothetical protein
MNAVRYWFCIFVIEVFIWAYVIYLHFEIKELEKIRKTTRLELEVFIRLYIPFLHHFGL